MGYIYVAETATTTLRAKTTGVAIFFIQGMATVYVYIAPIMLNAPALGMSNTGEPLTPLLEEYLADISKSSSGSEPVHSSMSRCSSWCRRPRAAASQSSTSCSTEKFQRGILRRLRPLCIMEWCRPLRTGVTYESGCMQVNSWEIAKGVVVPDSNKRPFLKSTYLVAMRAPLPTSGSC